MLNIYQGYYQNIGPLKNKSIMLNYKDGKVLVKAPIGTGKSFLFFDGPIFALYKSSERTIINKDSKKGQIQLLFSVDENYFLIVRQLSQTKSGKDSVKTQLYLVQKDKHLVDYLDLYNKEKIIQTGNDLLTLLNFHQVKLENLTSQFKQETELQANLNDLLPPKEVALTTIFLPQNSENIFELTPSARIQVLKKVFGILGIDDAKKIIDEKKKDLSNQIKALEEKTTYKEKIKQSLEKMIQLKNKLELSKLSELDFTDEFLEIDENLNLDKLNLIELNLEKYFKNLEEIKSKFIEEKTNYQNLVNQLEKLNQQKNQTEQETIKLKQEIQNLDNEKQQVQQTNEYLKQINQQIDKILQNYPNLNQDYEQLIKNKEQIKNLEENFNSLEKDIQQISQNIENIKQKIGQNNNQDLEKVNQRLDQIGKQLKDLEIKDFDFFKFEDKKVSNIKELENLFTEIKLLGLNYRKELERLEKEQKELEENLSKISKQNKTEKVEFMCKIIDKPCPLIKEIAKKFDKNLQILEEQKLNLEKKLEQVKQDLNKVKEKRDYLANYWKEKKVNQVLENIKKIQELEEAQKQLQEQKNKLLQKFEEISKLKGNLEEQEKLLVQKQEEKAKIAEKIANLKNNLNLEIEKVYQQYHDLQKKKESLQNKLHFSHNKILELSNKENHLKQLIIQKEKIEEEIEKLKQDLEKSKIKLEKYKNKYQLATKEEELLKNIMKEIGIFNSSLEEYNQNKLEIIKMKRKIKLLKDLSNIFGKELVIFVFSDYLKSLEELINYFIADVVNFKLTIQLDEKGENLDIFVEDEKGQRPISSLSGGQKTALRIGWILAISKLKQNKMLFLDETINNFDQESVEIIARKIKEFVENQEMKFYMITHSEILQQADIWTDIVELERI